MVMRRTDLLAGGLLLAGCVAAVLVLPAGSPPRVAAGLVLVLALPGAALARLALPTQRGVPERLLVALASGLATVVLLALLLDGLGLELARTSWAVALAVVALAALVLARPGGAPVGRPRWRPDAYDTALLTLAALVLAGALALGTRPLRLPPGSPGTAAVWVLPRGGNRVDVGVRSGERTRARFVLELSSRRARLRRSEALVLDPGQEAGVTVSVAPDLQARLLLDDAGARRLVAHAGPGRGGAP
jgi:hypothetical protein